MSRTRLLEPAAALIVESSRRQHLSMRCRSKRRAPLEGLSLIVEAIGGVIRSGAWRLSSSFYTSEFGKPSLVHEADFDEGSLLTELTLYEL